MNEKTDTAIQSKSNEIFTAALIGALGLALGAWLLILFLEKPLLIFFGANDILMPLALRYLEPIRYVIPSFLLVQMLAAFLRNDGNPALATFDVLAGGLFNVFGDLYFVFGLNMGIYGAGLATATGSVISLAVMACHFISRKNQCH